MIDKEQFDMMKPGALLVNTSRTEIVDEVALRQALHKNNLGGYADDFSRDKDYLFIYPTAKVIQTPHIGGNCIEAREATDIYIATKIKDYVNIYQFKEDSNENRDSKL